MKIALFAVGLATITLASQAHAAPGRAVYGRTVQTAYVNRSVQHNYSARVNTYRTVNHNYTVRTNYAGYSNRYVSYAPRYTNYHLTYGTRFAYGYCYYGRQHNHWSICRYDARYGCNCYYDPYACNWYYWCEPAACYYPVTYCPYRTYAWTAPVVQPVAVQPVVQVQPIIVQQPRTVVQAQPAPVQAATTTAYVQPQTQLVNPVQAAQTPAPAATTAYPSRVDEAPRLPATNLQTSTSNYPMGAEPVEPNANE